MKKTDTAAIARTWFSGFFAEKLVEKDSDGKLTRVTMYYDPKIDHIQGRGNLMGLGIAWYVLPFDPRLSYQLYHDAAEELGLYDDEYNAEDRLQFYGVALTFHQLALCMAIEFGEPRVEARLRDVLDTLAEPKQFGDGDFGFFYHMQRKWPVGQASALLMVAEVNSLGGWQRVFNNPAFRDRFAAPGVVKVEFPILGLSQAWNDPRQGTLTVSTYAATPSRAGAATTFKVVRVPDTKYVRVSCDGRPFDAWSVLDVGSLEIRTTIGEHHFVIYTGYRGPTGVVLEPWTVARSSKV